MRRVFVSLPYTHNDSEVVEFRVDRAKRECMRLFANGIVPLCPIVTGHSFYDGNTPITHKQWVDYALNILRIADEMVVLMIPGWEKSAGVTEEIELATHLGIPITYIGESLQCGM